MTRRSWWSFSSRMWLIILCVIVVLAIGFWTGWSLDHRFGDAIFFALNAGFSCILIVFAMALVRKLFEFHSVRILFDVLAVLIWAMIVYVNAEALIQGSSVSSISKREGLMLTPLVTIVFTVASVLVVTALGLALRLWTRFKGPRTKSKDDKRVDKRGQTP